MNTYALNQNRYFPACKNSVSSDTSLALNLSELEIYGINSSIALGLKVKKAALANVEEKLSSALGHDVPIARWIETNEGKARLSSQEIADLKEIASLICKDGDSAQMAFEQAIAEDGYARPALLLLVLAVAVAVALAVFVVSADNGLR
jgi:hypothetical protein